MKKRIYIAGAISGMPPDEVSRKFLNAETTINAMGHIPINPYKIVPKILPNDATQEQKDEFWIKAMTICLPEVMRCDAIYMLKDGLQSKGARIEHYTAQTMGKEIIYQENPR